MCKKAGGLAGEEGIEPKLIAPDGTGVEMQLEMRKDDEAKEKEKGKKKSKGVKKGVGAGAKGKAKLTKGVKKLTIAKAAAKKK